MDETNERGNCVERHYFSSDRYGFETLNCDESEGWKRVDTVQDLWNFGIWVHFERREVITYAQGDVQRIICSDDNGMKAELKAMAYNYAHTLVTLNGLEYRGNSRESLANGLADFVSGARQGQTPIENTGHLKLNDDLFRCP